MWLRIVLVMVALILISFPLQWLLPKPSQARRIEGYKYLMYDIAPLLGFFGVLLFALSLAQAAQQQAILAWALGDGLGIVAGACLWIAFAQSFRAKQAGPSRASGLRIAFRLVKTYGLVVLIALLGVNIAIRWLGPALEVLLAAALGVTLVVSGIGVFVQARQRATSNQSTR